MFKQKLSDIFRRDKKQRQDQPRKQQIIYFNQTYFDCKLAYSPHKLSLIKVIANITVGPDAGMPMMVNCRWLIKKNNQYSEIQGVTSSCYQPCIQDVGCSILVQITPLIEGKTYSGALITKQTGPLQLGSALQTQFTETKTKLYYQNQFIEFNMKVEAVFGKQTQYSNLQYPQDGKLIIRKHQDNNFQVEIATSEFKTYFWITKQYPTAEFIRKSYNSVVISLTQYQSMRLAFKQNTDRQILGLLLRTLTANSTLDWPIKLDGPQKIQQNQQNRQNQSPKGQKVEQNQQDQKQDKKQDKRQEKKSQKNISQHNISNSIKSQQKIESEVFKSQQYESPNPSPLKSQKSLGSNENLVFETPQRKSSQKECQSGSVQLEMKVGQLNTQLNKLKKQLKDLTKNYNLQKQNKCKLEHQLKKSLDRTVQFDQIKKQRDQLQVSNQKFKQDNRFYRNQVTLLKKTIKKQQGQIQLLTTQKQDLAKRNQKFQLGQIQSKKFPGQFNQNSFKNETQNWRKLYNQLTQQNQQLKAQIQKLENSLTTANKKIQSLHHQKIINNHPKTEQIAVQNPTIISTNSSNLQLAAKNRIIDNLEFKISNLQMLLKHRSGQKGNQTLALHKIINNLTQDIRQKEEQLQSVKKVNKDLMDRLRIMPQGK